MNHVPTQKPQTNHEQNTQIAHGRNTHGRKRNGSHSFKCTTRIEDTCFWCRQYHTCRTKRGTEEHGSPKEPSDFSNKESNKRITTTLNKTVCGAAPPRRFPPTTILHCHSTHRHTHNPTATATPTHTTLPPPPTLPRCPPAPQHTHPTPAIHG